LLETPAVVTVVPAVMLMTPPLPPLPPLPLPALVPPSAVIFPVTLIEPPVPVFVVRVTLPASLLAAAPLVVMAPFTWMLPVVMCTEV